MNSMRQWLPFTKKDISVNLDPTGEVLQLMGSQDGLSHLATAIVNPGEYVLVPDPGYPIYEASVTHCRWFGISNAIIRRKRIFAKTR